MKRSLQQIGGVFLLVSVVAGGCAPSVNQAVKADIDRRIAALGPSAQSYGAPIGFSPMPFQTGQWTTHKLIDGDGQA